MLNSAELLRRNLIRETYTNYIREASTCSYHGMFNYKKNWILFHLFTTYEQYLKYLD